MSIIYCQYGCGQQAKFKTKGGRNICSQSSNKCPANRKKNSQGVKKAHQKEPEKWKGHLTGFASKRWKQNNPEKELKRIQRISTILKQRYKSGQIIPGFSNKNHTLKTRQRLSQIAGQRQGCGFKSNIKYYKVYCPYLKKHVKVLGTWQLKYAQYLNDNSVLWQRKREVNFQYKLSEDDIVRTYYPDFHLIESNDYIEIKGYFPPQDQLKMKKVKEYNPEANIIMLFCQDLKQLGIII